MTFPPGEVDVDVLERVVRALSDNFRLLEELHAAIQTLTAAILGAPLDDAPDHRPIEERGAPERTIQRDAE